MPSSPHQSLHQLSVENSWFATRPILWTSKHLDLLGVRFQHFDGPLHAPQPRGDDAAELDVLRVGFNVMRLAMVQSTEDKIKSALYLLCTPGSPLEPKPEQSIAYFFYAGRPVHVALCHVLHVAKPSLHAQPPVLQLMAENLNQQTELSTYYREFERERKRQYTARTRPGRGKNLPVEKICKIVLRRVTPENWAEDPYIVCLLLSLAQAQLSKQKGPMPKSFPVRLLVAVDGDRMFAHVFQAEIDARILKALHEPRFNLDGVTWPQVKHTKVAFDPWLTFPHRIATEMLGSYMEQM
ncbi:uncharacterized protein FSUBG_3381 [Fusarium subglutinans]|uniref:Uncharacterized protein n=1 Tax=Gibberella subglutinans TaxID=42677 RepID=A0A8H5Q7N5_GIBSU|nr:uncharacterized protein FSUBG_3381 [Fusarium subglutinans]KAF5610149.1 hypothetical protein FSUBG_3381 [Fusarium subglutinans]